MRSSVSEGVVEDEEDKGFVRFVADLPASQLSDDGGFSDFSSGFDAEVMIEAALVVDLAEEVNNLCNCRLGDELSALRGMDSHRDGIEGVRHVRAEMCDRSTASPTLRSSMVLLNS
jgi:hypothetical protein